jgi:sec-independent protein translocase protein TatA
MGWESPSHWVIIALVVVVLFGYKKLPEMSRSVGRSLRIVKTEMKGMGEDDSARTAEVPAEPARPAVVVPPPAVVQAPSPANTVPASTGSTDGVPATPVAPAANVPLTDGVPATNGTPASAAPAPAAEVSRETPQQPTQA